MEQIIEAAKELIVHLGDSWRNDPFILRLEMLIQATEQQIFIMWSTEHVLETAKEQNINLTEAEALDILYEIKKNHDASIGVNWDVLETQIWLYDKERTE